MVSFDEGRPGSHGPPGRQDRGHDGGLLVNTLKVLASVYVASVLIWGLAAANLSIEPHVPLVAGGVLAVIFVLVLLGLPQHRHPRFGYANIVTALRASLISMVGAVVLFSDTFRAEHFDHMIWATCGAVMFALSLDGVDGYLARRFRQASALGARFDMELDAFLILILSVAATELGKAGPWVLLIGALRYLFVMAQWFLPLLREELPESFRRKLICVVQVAALCGVMLPFVTQPVSGILCALALSLLVYSFAVDTIHLLLRKEHRP
ncbi:CDP-alcohol phosphatidyltransferase family protein [Rhizobium sp. FY34]|uniref:CDP-alcohol phosphatidyltransferase family protein n=1 Tax=Rhizobium sp. FY34 TaxID=2562309 RepID=UPI0010BFC755|nr:CDP-alcohol phosphatidyltransferase family protein [Rhizobium sp. FY34]